MDRAGVGEGGGQGAAAARGGKGALPPHTRPTAQVGLDLSQDPDPLQAEGRGGSAGVCDGVARHQRDGHRGWAAGDPLSADRSVLPRNRSSGIMV